MKGRRSEPDVDPESSGPPELANVEAEAALLGALMIDNSLVDELILAVRPEDFFEAVHGRIFAAILARVTAGEVATPITLRPMFEGDEIIAQLGGPSYLSQLTGSGAALVGARDFAKQVADLARARRLRDGTLAALATLRDTSSGIAIVAAVSELETASAAAIHLGGDGVKSFSGAQAIDRVVNRIVEIQEGGVPAGVTIDGISDLQDLLGALQPGHFHIWAGRPGMGKTAVACSTALGAARAGFGTGLISLEMSDIDLGERLIADLCHAAGERAITHERIRDADVSARELAVISDQAARLRKLPLEFIEASGITIGRLGSIARKMKRQFEIVGHPPLRLLLVDYAQLLSGNTPGVGRTEAITEVSGGLKQLARQLDCCVVALAQLNREVERREDKRPTLSDLRDTGAFEQDADVVMFLYREEYYLQATETTIREGGDAKKIAHWEDMMQRARDRIEFIVAKRRNGAIGRSKGFYFRNAQAVRGKNFYELGGIL